MAEINTSIYGEEANWVNVYDYYAAGTEDKDKLKIANFGNRHTTIGAAIEQGKLELNTSWDKSLSYCGLGSEAPLSNIEWFAKLPNEGGSDGNNITMWGKKDKRTITNFALGISAEGITGPTQKRSNGYWVKGDQWAPNKFKFNRWNDGSVYSNDMSNYRTFSPYTLIPLHRVVLVPIILAARPDNYTTTFDLISYFQNDNKQNYPRIRQIGMRIAIDPDPSKYPDINEAPLTGFQRIFPGDGMREIAILDNTIAFDGQESDNYGPLDTTETLGEIFLPVIGGCRDSGDQYCPIAGDLYGCADIQDNWGSAFLLRPFCSGFGLNFNQWSKIQDGNWRTGENGYLYCDASQLTNDQVKEAVRHMVACFGLFFVDGIDDLNVPFYDNKMMLGILDEGLGHGEYSRGEDNKNQDQWTMEDAHDIDFDPANPPRIDPNDYDEDLASELRVPLYAQIGGHTYITTGTKFQEAYENAVDNIKTSLDAMFMQSAEVADAIHDYEADPTDANYEKIEKAITVNEAEGRVCKSLTDRYNGLHSNPINCVCSIMAFPFDLTNYISFTNSDRIIWGTTWQTTNNPASGDFKLVNGCKSQFWVPGGECSYFDEYQNFLDYSPYCSAELYIPYCGSVQIDPETFIGHKLSVRYLVDWHTGACLAFIYRDSLIVDQISGQMGISIPMIAADNLSYANSMFEGSQQLKHAKTSSIATTVSGLADGFIQGFKTVLAPTPISVAQAAKTAVNSAASMANSWNDVKSAEYDLNTKQLSFKQLTTATPMTSTGNEQFCRLVIYRPTFLDGYAKKSFGDYGHTTGFACLKNTKLSGFTGLTVCSSVDLSGISQATEKEKAMISSALKGGVYIKKTS